MHTYSMSLLCGRWCLKVRGLGAVHMSHVDLRNHTYGIWQSHMDLMNYLSGTSELCSASISLPCKFDLNIEKKGSDGRSAQIL